LKNIVVTSVVFNVASNLSGIFVADQTATEYAGVLVTWKSIEADPTYGYDAPELGVGKVIEVVGVVSEFCGISEPYYTSCSTQVELTPFKMDKGAIIDTGDTAEPPAAVLVDPAKVKTGGENAEKYQDMLVYVENVSVEDNDLGYGQFSVTGGLVVDDDLYHYTIPMNGYEYPVLTGFIYTSYDAFKLLPRKAEDMGETPVDGDYDYELDGDKPEDGTIAYLQFPETQPETGTAVTLSGVLVTTAGLYVSSSIDGFTICEDECGQWQNIIAVYYKEDFDPSVAPGDVVDLVGTFEEYCGTGTYCSSQIKVTSVTKTGTDTVPEPHLIANPADIATGGALAEPYQSALVKVEDVTVENNEAGYGQFAVTGGLMIDDLLFFYDLPTVGTTYETLAGVTHTSYNESKLIPRDAGDMLEGDGPDGDVVDGDEVDGDVPVDGDVEPTDGLVITEIHKNPAAFLDDKAEFVEVYNGSASSIDLNGCTLKDKDTDTHTIASANGPTVVPVGGYLVLCVNSDSGTNGGVTGCYQYADFVLANGGDEVIIECSSTILDQVYYTDEEFPDTTGKSMQLSSGSYSATANDDGANWCDSTTLFASDTEYGDDYATPGTANVSCQ